MQQMFNNCCHLFLHKSFRLMNKTCSQKAGLWEVNIKSPTEFNTLCKKHITNTCFPWSVRLTMLTPQKTPHNWDPIPKS